jgi:hydrogenase maturation protease
MYAHPKICIAGIGNPIRTDDGIGYYVCSQLDKLQLAGITTMPVHQLQVELIETFSIFDYVILVDAAVNGGDVEFHPLTKGNSSALSSSHHINPEMLFSLSELLKGSRLHMFICKIKGVDFGFGEQLSPVALMHADKAIKIIENWISAL